MLNIKQEQIHIFRNGKELVRLRVSAGFNGRIDSLALAGHKELPGSFRLCRTFAAAQGNAAA